MAWAAVLGIDGLQDGVALSVGGYDGQHFLLLLQGDARELPHFFRIGPTGPDDRSAPRAGGPRRLHDLVGVTCVDGSQN